MSRIYMNATEEIFLGNKHLLSLFFSVTVRKKISQLRDNEKISCATNFFIIAAVESVQVITFLLVGKALRL